MNRPAGITHTSKGKNDECYTPSYAVEPLLEFLKPFKDKTIWCPFDKESSEFVKILTNNGFKVVYSHIDYGQNFFTYEPKEWDLVVSNPPFTGKHDIFKRLYTLNKPFALVMDVRLLNDAAPMRTFRKNGLELLLFDDRMQFKNQPNGTINFACGYFCKGIMPTKFEIRDFSNKNQLKLI